MVFDGVIVAQTADELGGPCALSYVPEAYLGHCEIRAGHHVLAVVDGVALANRIAAYAIGPNGGYSDVSINTSNQQLTCRTFETWVLNGSGETAK